jgi:hypothetical protein
MAKPDFKKKQALQKKETSSSPQVKENKVIHKTIFDQYHLLIIGLIFTIAFVLYYPTLKYGFVMDDGAVITDNKTVKRGTEAIIQLFKESSVYGSTGENFGTYRPLIMAMFAYEYSIAKGSPYLHHFLNVLFYGICCVVVYTTLRKFLKKFNPFIPLIATLLFIVHPVHSEVVANIKSRDEIMSMLFLFAAAGFMFDYFEQQKKSKQLISWLFFTLALFSKESAVTFLFIIPLLFYFFTEVPLKRVLQACAPYLTSLFVYLIARSAVLDPITSNMPVINNVLVEAKNLGEKFATISFIMFLYIKNLLTSNGLSFDYGYAHVTIKQFSDPIVITTFLMFVWMFIYVIWKFKTKNIWVFSILFYLATLSVSSNVLVMIAATMADRFLFVPSLAFTIAIAAGFISMFKIKLNDEKNIKWLVLTPALVIGGFWFVKTSERNPVWESNYTLFKSGTISAPKSYRTNRAFAVENLVTFQKEVDTTKKAQYLKDMTTYYRKAVAIYPKMADDCFNMAICYYYNNNLDSAKIWYNNCVNINSNYSNAQYNMAMIYSNEKNHDLALKHFLEVYRVNKDFMDTNFKIGLHYHYKNDFSNAIPFYEQFLATHPGNTDVLSNLSLAYLGLKQNDKYTYYQQQLAIAKAAQSK